MTYTEQLERETEQTRSQIASTLEELRACMTPGQVVNQLADQVGDAGARAFFANLKRQTVDNPVPVALIGAGLAWLMLGASEKGRSVFRDARQRLGDAGNAAAESIRDTADAATRAVSRKGAELSDAASRKGAEWSEATSAEGAQWSEAASRTNLEWSDKTAALAEDARNHLNSAADRAGQSARDVGNTFGQMAGAATDAVQHSASTSYEAVSESARKATAAMGNSARAAGQRTLQGTNALVEFCREQPLVLAGLGLAIGATLGALLPPTETEDQLLGETSDQLKERARDTASEHVQAAKKVGERALDTAQQETAKQASPHGQTAPSDGKTGASVADEATLVPPDQIEERVQEEGKSPDHAHP